jgi:hypothetical protein
MSSQVIDNLIQDYLRSLATSSDFSLSPIQRQTIYTKIESYASNPIKIYAHLDYLALQKVLALLDPDDEYMQKYSIAGYLEWIELLLEEKISHSAGRAQAQRLSRLIEAEIDATEAPDDETLAKTIGAHPGPELGFIPFVLCEALCTVSGLFRFMEGSIHPEDSDADFDIWSRDAASWAVLAYAGDQFSNGVDLSRRKEFWEWWLSKAIPSALAASSLPSIRS